MRNFCFLLILSFEMVILGCTGKAGPEGPSGSSGTPATQSFQAFFQNGVYPTSGYAGELDTWLNGTAGSPQNALPYLEVNTGANYLSYGRILTKFDVSSLPTNITVIAAEVWLKLEAATSIGSAPVTIGLHNLASSTFSGCHWLGNATWTGTGTGTWNTCTGDLTNNQLGYINPTTMSTVAFSSSVNGTSSFYKWNVDPAVVQSWLTSATNNTGLIFKSEGEFGEGTSSVGFYPYNDSTAGNRPTLIISYK